MASTHSILTPAKPRTHSLAASFFRKLTRMASGTFAALTAAYLLFGPSETTAREVYNIDARWTFFTGNDIDTATSSVIYLPHTWNSDATLAPGAYYRGTGNYLKEIDIPLEWAGKRVFLRVGGAATVTDIFINAHHAASHEGGSASFTPEITHLITPGRTDLFRIVVNNSPRFDVLPTAGEENIYGGIYRGVELIVCDSLSVSPSVEGADGVRITTTHITEGKAEGNVRLTLLDMPAPPEGALARITVLDADRRVVARNSVPITGLSAENPKNSGNPADSRKPDTPDNILTLPFSVSKPRLWQGTADPYLYEVEIALVDPAGLVTDSLSLRTGFRTIGFDDSANAFLLNGKPLRLRGVILHRDRMMVGTALTPFQIEEDVRLIRELGANAVRVTGGGHSDYFYDLCDEAGLIVWNDGPFTGRAYPTDIDFVDTPAFRDNGALQLREMVSRLSNHPSIAMWGIFSNVSTQGDDPVPYIRSLDRMVKELDPYRLTASSSVQDGGINFITDMVSFDRSPGWGAGMPDGIVPWIANLASWPDLHAGLSYSAGASIYHQSEKLQKTVPESNHHPEGWQTFFHEQYMLGAVDALGLWGVFVGDMFDFGAVRNPWGDGKGMSDHGLVTFDRKDRKDAFYIYKANWNTTDPFVHIVGGRVGTLTDRRPTIRVYSNRPEAELFVAGRSQGKRTGDHGVFVWDGVDLRPGLNRLEARAGGAKAFSSVMVGTAAPTTRTAP